MNKKIHHVWDKPKGTVKNPAKCTRCTLEKYFDFDFMRDVYHNIKTGILHYDRAPSCILPNTKL